MCKKDLCYEYNTRNHNLLRVKRFVLPVAIIHVIIIVMYYIELRMHNFFVAEQWRGD